jgi:hypothetical protein
VFFTNAAQVFPFLGGDNAVLLAGSVFAYRELRDTCSQKTEANMPKRTKLCSPLVGSVDVVGDALGLLAALNEGLIFMLNATDAFLTTLSPLSTTGPVAGHPVTIEP